MKIFKLLFAFAVFVTCSLSALTVNAADWQVIDEGQGVKIELNADNITRVNGVYTAWVRNIYQAEKQELSNGQKVAMVMEKFSLRTTNSGDEFKSIEFYEYNPNGDLIKKLNGTNNWESIIPGTLGETIYDKVKELRKDADAADDKKAKAKKREQQTKEAVKQATNIAGGILGGLF